MARKKLQRFAENAQMAHVIEPERNEVLDGLSLAGRWREAIFENDRPLILELGCGKGEYSVALAQRDPHSNYLGIDIKGSRIWYGAKEGEEKGLNNLAFLRTQIELLDRCFAADEVDEIWITFPDPQIKFARTKHRLTHPDFLKRYAQVLKADGLVHLKTDSEFLHGYTQATLEAYQQPILQAFFNIDRQMVHEPQHVLHQVRTHYEEQFRAEGKAITYLKFKLDQRLLP